MKPAKPFNAQRDKIDFRPIAARVLVQLAELSLTPLSDVILVEHLVDWHGRALPPDRHGLFVGTRFARRMLGCGPQLDPAWMREHAATLVRSCILNSAQAHVVPTRSAAGERVMGRTVDYSVEVVELPVLFLEAG